MVRLRNVISAIFAKCRPPKVILTIVAHIIVATRRYLPLITAFVAAFVCFIPKMIYDLESGIYATYGDNSLEKALYSMRFQFSLISCISISLPILLEFSLDTYISVHQSRTVELSMFTLLITLLIPSLSLLFYAVPNGEYDIIPGLLSARAILIVASAISFLNLYGGTIFQAKYSILGVILYAISQILTTFELYYPRKTVDQIWIVKLVTQFSALAIFITFSIKWALHVRGKQLSSDELCCSLHIFAFFFYIVCSIITWNVTESGTTWLSTSTEYISFLIYIQTAYTALVTILHGRLARFTLVSSHSKKELETRRMLVGYFSHEMRTPLNSVLMGLQVMKQEVLKKAGLSYLVDTVEELQGACSTATDILNDLLVYENLETGSMELQRKPVPVVSFLQEKVESFMLQANAKRIILDLTFSRAESAISSAYINVDEEKFSQVIRHVIANAIDSTPSFTVISVRTEFVHVKAAAETMPSPEKTFVVRVDRNTLQYNPKDKYLLRIHVIDRGPTISKEDQGRIFRDAMLFTAGILQGFEGRSLKLWISRRIAELHGGTVTMTPLKGNKGNVFTVELPVFFPHMRPQEPKTEERPLRNMAALALRGVAQFKRMRSTRSVATDPGVSRTESVGKLMARGHEYPKPVAVRSTPNSPLMAKAVAQIGPCSPVMKPSALVRRGSTSIRKNSTSVRKNSTSFRRVETSERRAGNSVRLYSTSPSEDGVAFSNIKEVKEEKMADDMITTVQGRSRRILVVDDAPMNRKMLCRLIEGKCDETITAEDGAVAVERMRDAIDNGERIDVVLMDYQMPNLDGPSAAKKMRDMGYTGPIIGVTGNTLPVHVSTFMANGADEVLSKPLNLDHLSQALASMGKAHLLE